MLDCSRRSVVLHVVTLASATGRYGGPFDTAVRQTVLAEELGFDARLFAAHLPGDEPFFQSLESVSRQFVQARMLSSKLGFPTVFSMKCAFALFKAVRSADVVHVSAAREAVPILALLAAYIFRVPYVVQGHGMLTSRSSAIHKIIDLVLRPLVRSARSVIALTEVEAAELATWMGSVDSILTLGNPVPRGLSAEVRPRATRDEAVFIARLHKRKQVSTFLSAAASSFERMDGHDYVVIGPDEGDLPLVQESMLSLNNVRYEGTLSPDDVTKRVARTGVFVLTSTDEPWGNVLATSLACGVPVVVPRSAALASLVARYGAGEVFEDGDSEQVCELIHKLLHDDSHYKLRSCGAISLSEAVLSEEHQKRVLVKIYSQPLATRL